MFKSPRMFAMIVPTIVFMAMSMVAAQHKKDDKEHGDKDGAPKMPSCVVMADDPINLAVSIQTDDGPVYFCCERCIDKYKGNPKKYADSLKAQRAALEKLPHVQVACPVEGEPIDKKASMEHKGQKVGFCCEKCMAKFKADPAKYEAKLLGSYTYQTKCPVAGEPVDPKAFKKIGDNKVYFCCEKCMTKFDKDPGKYLPKLDEQGMSIDMKAVEAKEKAGEKSKEMQKKG